MTNQEPRLDKPTTILEAVAKYVLGGAVGGVEGIIGATTIPSSLRCIYNKIDGEYLKNCSSPNRPLEDKIGSVAYLAGKLPVRLSFHYSLLHNALQNLGDVVSQGGSIEDLNSAWLLVPNLVSLAYEIGRGCYKRGQNNSSRKSS